MESKSGNKISLSFEPSKKIFERYSRLSALIRLLFVCLFTSSCAQSITENIERGAGYMYRAGYPEVRMSAIGLFDEQSNAHINVAANVVYGSLIYKEVKQKQTAYITIEVRIVKTSGETEGTVRRESYNLTVSETEKNNITSSQDVFTFDHRYAVEPGEYKVFLTVLDQSSNRHTTRQSTTIIPEADDQRPVLTNIQLLARDNQGNHPGYEPITTYDVRGSVDSLKFVFQVTQRSPRSPITINSELVRFKSDTSHARPMAFPEPSPSNIQYKGIEYDKREVIQSSRRVLDQTGSVMVEFIFPVQARGNYRFSARINTDEEEEIFKARDFSIKSKNYPTIKTPHELARPLAYLMAKKDYKKLMNIKDPDSLKQQIDIFWLKNIGNKSRAKQVISLYYQRVEEANKQFSNFKEGWKTDPGMIYILFGPPLYYDQYIDRMAWFYSYDRGDLRESFYFDKPKIRHPSYPFDNFILMRDFYYDSVEYQQQQIWLSGLILNGTL